MSAFPALYTSLGPSQANGGFSGAQFGSSAGLPYGFGFPSFGDPQFFFIPAASSFMINNLLGFANGSATNINIGPVPHHLGMGSLLRGFSFFGNDPGACDPGGDPFTFHTYGPGSPGYGTPFMGGGHFAPPGYGGPFGTPWQPGPSPFDSGGPFGWVGTNNPGPWAAFLSLMA